MLEGRSYRALVNLARILDFIPVAMAPPWARMMEVINTWSDVSFFFFPIIFMSWRLITLQYCSGFCHTLYAFKDQSSCWVEKRWNMLE